MRRVIAEKAVRAGDTVRIFSRLRGEDKIRLSVWCAQGGTDLFSPFVENEHLDVEADRPMMLSPMIMWVSPLRKKHVAEFTVREAMRIQVRQEYDRESELRPKVRISRYGKTAYEVRRHFRDAFRAIRRLAAPVERAR